MGWKCKKRGGGGIGRGGWVGVGQRGGGGEKERE